MLIDTIRTGYLKLDGGAMFGIVPRKLWQKLNPPDEDNMCTWCMRALLIRDRDRIIVVDTGIGGKQDDRFRQHFSPTQQDLFARELARHGVHPEEVTDVLFTHLHFDHSGGAILQDAKGKPAPFFPAARHWTSRRHYHHALAPNAREKASFLPENFKPLETWGLLHFADEDPAFQWLPAIDLWTVNGHTEAMYVPIVTHPEAVVIYCADLIPSSHHIGLPYIMAYDIRPLDTLAEKARLLEYALEQDAILVFEHDPAVEACRLTRSSSGRIEVGETGRLKDLMNVRNEHA
jgi:glyoxylase-like metal-dependent hydrolase (beta-lactamase superfamily II)